MDILTSINRKKNILVLIFRVLFTLAIVGSVYELNWMSLFVSILALILSFTPEFVKKKYQIRIPNFIQIFTVIFLFTSLILGEVQSFYYRFWWWDSLLHLFSGIALGFSGFLLVYVLYKTDRLNVSPLILSIIIFSSAVTVGVIWEVFEFAMDTFLHLNMQKSRNLCEVGTLICDTRLGVIDTMIDLILDIIGASYASVIAYFYFKGVRFDKLLESLVEEFELKNKHIFKH